MVFGLGLVGISDKGPITSPLSSVDFLEGSDQILRQKFAASNVQECMDSSGNYIHFLFHELCFEIYYCKIFCCFCFSGFTIDRDWVKKGGACSSVPLKLFASHVGFVRVPQA